MQLSRALFVLSAVLLAGVDLSHQVKQDYYKILGLERDAKPQQIKKAFRKQAAKYHPDKNKDPGAEEKFKEINEAHEVLMNPEKRKHYDMFGHSDGTRSSGHAQGSGPGGFTFHFDSDDMIRNFFGHEFGGNKPPVYFTQQEFYGRPSHGQQQQQQQQQNYFSFNDIFEEEEHFGDFFGGADPHRFGGGSSFFGSHYGGGQPQAAHSGHWGQGQAPGSRCRTITQRVGNMVTTYTQCS